MNTESNYIIIQIYYSIIMFNFPCLGLWLTKLSMILKMFISNESYKTHYNKFVCRLPTWEWVLLFNYIFDIDIKFSKIESLFLKYYTILFISK